MDKQKALGACDQPDREAVRQRRIVSPRKTRATAGPWRYPSRRAHALDIALIGTGGLPTDGSSANLRSQSAVQTAGPTGGRGSTEDGRRGGSYRRRARWLDPICAKEHRGRHRPNLYVSQPDTGEQAPRSSSRWCATTRSTSSSNRLGGVAVPRAEIEGEMGDAHVSLQARLMSQAAQAIAIVSKARTCVVLSTRCEGRVMFSNPEVARADARQVLRLGAHRSAQGRTAQGQGRPRRQPRVKAKGGQEQARAAVPTGRVRHHLR